MTDFSDLLTLNQSNANAPECTNTHTLQHPYLTILQLPMHHSLPSLAPTQIRHRHKLHHQTSPARKMLRSLPRARFGVILLPREARPFPFVEDVFDEVFAEGGVDVGGLRLVGAGLDCDVLNSWC